MKKQRTEIPREIAARVLVESDRTCCVCHIRGRHVQIHHIDNDPSHSDPENLAVLCLECHHETQLRGGFDRKLDASQIVLYKQDWATTVATKRKAEQGPAPAEVPSPPSKMLRYLQIKEENHEHLYSLEADYPQLDQLSVEADINGSITSFVNRALQRFRGEAIARAKEKQEMKRGGAPAVWDDLTLSHKIWLFTENVLSIEFKFLSYYASAMHPNTITRTLNFARHPLRQLELQDIFEPTSNYLLMLSDYCVADLHRQQPEHWGDPEQRAEQLKHERDHWILSGAGPTHHNYDKFVLVEGGLRIFFDAYQVGSYAEGAYDVFVPTSAMVPALKASAAAMLGCASSDSEAKL